MSYIGGRGAEEGASLSVVTESEGFLCRVVKGHGVPARPRLPGPAAWCCTCF